MDGQDKQSVKRMREFAVAHLAELSGEICEWHEAGVLRDGKLRELAKMCAFGHEDKLQHAERMVERLAMETVARSAGAAAEHLYVGNCPDELQPYARDSECPACSALQFAPDVGELNAWRARFPQYEYRPQDEVVALSLDAREQQGMRNALPPLPRPKYRMASSGIPSDGYSAEQMRDYALAACQPAELDALKALSKSFAYRRDRLIEARSGISGNDWERASAFEVAHDELEAVLAAGVPPAMTVPYGGETADKGYAYGYEKGRADGWNAYRDEMLKVARLEAEKPSQE